MANVSTVRTSPQKGPTLGDRIYYSRPHTAVCLLVRYKVHEEADIRSEFDKLESHYGIEAWRVARLDCCQYDWEATPVTVRLKDAARKLCFQLLGPAPEQEDWFYRHPGGAERERPAKKLPPGAAEIIALLMTDAEKEALEAPEKKGKGGKAAKPLFGAAPPKPEKALEPVVHEEDGESEEAESPKATTTTVMPPTTSVSKDIPPPSVPFDARAAKKRYKALKVVYNGEARGTPTYESLKKELHVLRRKLILAGAM